MFVYVLTGWLAGFVHVLSGPDHLAAVAPLAADGSRRDPGRKWMAGLQWGMGHASGVFALAVLALLLRGVLPLDRMSSWSERVVGVVLIAVGLWGLRRAFRSQLHTHVHEHDGLKHVHVHVHARDSAHAAAPVASRAQPHCHTHAAYAVGVLHGFAGTSHLLGVLPALALPTRAAAILYLVAFGLGSVTSMAGFSWLVGAAGERFAAAGPRPFRWLLASCSLGAIAVGIFWLRQ